MPQVRRLPAFRTAGALVLLCLAVAVAPAYAGINGGALTITAMTDDGDAAHRLQHPSGEVEREYRVEVAGTVGRDAVARLLAGVELDDGMARARSARVLEAGPVTSTATLVLTEGRKREVRRMLSVVGHPVLKLTRIRFGTVELGDLEPGGWRSLTDHEREHLLDIQASR